MVEFIKWDSAARLFRDVIVTEKLDGTNACVIFERIDPIDMTYSGPEGTMDLPNRALRLLTDGGITYAVYAQSRNCLITPSSDNAGFAKWVEQNYQQIFYVLGEGRHYGEWWGQGIGRKYDMDRKVFSVFNTAGWIRTDEGTPGEDSRAKRAFIAGININCVPVLAQHTFNERIILEIAEKLKNAGSFATAKYTGKAFPNPEGICIYHKAADTIFKYTFDNNDQHKWELEAPESKGAIATLWAALRRK